MAFKANHIEQSAMRFCLLRFVLNALRSASLKNYRRFSGVYRKFMEILKVISGDSLEKEKKFDDIIVKLEMSDINLFKVNDELRILEKSRLMEDEDLDTIKSVVVYLFMKNSGLETEEIYALVYGNGRSVMWH